MQASQYQIQCQASDRVTLSSQECKARHQWTHHTSSSVRAGWHGANVAEAVSMLLSPDCSLYKETLCTELASLLIVVQSGSLGSSRLPGWFSSESIQNHLSGGLTPATLKVCVASIVACHVILMELLWGKITFLVWWVPFVDIFIVLEGLPGAPFEHFKSTSEKFLW